jgi:hypothetical protein
VLDDGLLSYALADGSVHLTSNVFGGAKEQVFRAALTRNGGETIDFDKLKLQRSPRLDSSFRAGAQRAPSTQQPAHEGKQRIDDAGQIEPRGDYPVPAIPAIGIVGPLPGMIEDQPARRQHERAPHHAGPEPGDRAAVTLPGRPATTSGDSSQSASKTQGSGRCQRGSGIALGTTTGPIMADR